MASAPLASAPAWSTLVAVHSVDADAASGMPLKNMLAGVPCVVHQHASAEEFLTAYDPDRAAGLVLDLALPEMSGLELLGHLEHRTLRLPTLVLTAQPDVENAVSTQHFVIGVLPKSPDPERLRDHCRTMVRLAEVMAVARRELRQLQRLVCTLTERELAVFEMLGKGHSTKQIADLLAVSMRTANLHQASVMRKLGAETSAAMALLAARFYERDDHLRAPS